jgi:ketosteroid isomerase-like protein
MSASEQLTGVPGVEKPEQWWQTWVTHFDKGEMDGIINLYAPGAVVVATPGNPVQGEATIRETIQSLVSLHGKLKWAQETVIPGPRGGHRVRP